MQTILRGVRLSCPSCVSVIESELKHTAGVHAATVHFATGRIEIEHDARARLRDMLDAVARSGYSATLGA